jgi:ribosomal protein S1
VSEATSTLTDKDVKPKMEIKGTVKKVQLAGAIIDLGDGLDGLLHVSQIEGQGTANVADVLSEGQEVTVWVRNTDPSGRIAVTMLRPPLLDWSDIKVGQTLTGQVLRIKKFGAFIDIGAERPGLVHISELSHDFVEKPGDVVSRGQEVEVRVIGVDASKKQIDLTMKTVAPIETQIVEKEVVEVTEPEDDEPMTAIAVALLKAQGKDSAQTEKRPKKRSKSEIRAEQEDIFKRTLEHHSDH